MRLVVGLGNPGRKYSNNRHNVGYMVIDRIATSDKLQVTRKRFNRLVTCYLSPNYGVILAKPQTMMNSSGEAVSSLATYYKLHAADIYVVHDDLDIKLGEYKIQKGKGPREHKGLLSIYEKLGTRSFWHVRIGIENRSNKIQNPNDKIQKIPGEKYVLQNFTDEELVIINKVVGEVASEMIKLL